MPRQRHWLILFLAGLLVGVVVALLMLPRQARHASEHPHPAVNGFPVTVTDALRRTVTVKQRPAHIVAIAPNATEILFALGAGDRVLADTTYCDYPPAAARLPKIGGYTNPNVEKIVALKPDLVLGARGNPLDLITQMQSLGLTVAAVDATTIAEVDDAIRLIGRLVGEEVAAEQLTTRLDARRAAIEQRTQSLPTAKRPRVLFLFSLDGLFSAGTGSFIDELIRLGGGTNIAARTGRPWPELSMETITATDPQVILLLAGQMDGSARPALTSATALAKLRALPRWRTLTAVKQGRVTVLDDDALTLPGPRLLDGLEAVAAALHPALFGKGAK